jgi:hypothetical protein
MDRENLKGQIAILKKKLMEYETHHQNAEILTKRITEEAHISEMYQKERDGYQERLGKVQEMLERAIGENSSMKLGVHQYEIERSRFVTEVEH